MRKNSGGLIKMKYTILEFEEEKVAKIEPSVLVREKLPSNKLVITFFWRSCRRIVAARKNRNDTYYRWRKSTKCLQICRFRCVINSWKGRMSCLWWRFGFTACLWGEFTHHFNDVVVSSGSFTINEFNIPY